MVTTSAARVSRRSYGYLRKVPSRRRPEFEQLASVMAEARIDVPGRGGGMYDVLTGDGEAWMPGDSMWHISRAIRRGQWAGPWRRSFMGAP